MVYTVFNATLEDRGSGAEHMHKNKNKNPYRKGVPVVFAKGASKSQLFKIGHIANAYGILPSTINHYTREGLLPEDARSRGGYRLYHLERTLDRLRRIERLQRDRRLSIEEIKKVL